MRRWEWNALENSQSVKDGSQHLTEVVSSGLQRVDAKGYQRLKSDFDPLILEHGLGVIDAQTCGKDVKM
jgi:hypothetical protein